MRSVQGIVRSGIGDHARWVLLLQEHYARKTGATLHPGTLNVELTHEWSVPAGSPTLEPEEYGGRVRIHIVRCRFMGEAAWILRTEANERGDGDHEKSIVEIASPLHLRKAYALKDGAQVTVELP